MVGDGILGRDFKQIHARVSYQNRTPTFTYAGSPSPNHKVVNPLGTDKFKGTTGPHKNIAPVQDYSEIGIAWSATAEGLVERKELLLGVYVVGSLGKVVNGCVILSVLNTAEKEVKISEPVMLTEVYTGGPLIGIERVPRRVIRKIEKVLN